jgi:hypothetical protein
MACLCGPWHSSGTVEGACLFAVVWSTHSDDRWEPLHDFTPADQLRLIEMGRALDAGQYGVWR